jgi:UDP-glucose 4-epimerase
VIPRFADAARRGKALTIFGDGNQTRDFVHVSDAVGALASALEKESSEPRVLNIGSGIGTSVNQLVELLQAEFDNRLTVRFLRARSGEIRHSVAAIGWARRTLGYAPKVRLRAGVRDYLASLARRRP